MARTRGARNANYEVQRLELARRLRPTVMRPGGVRTSLRELAAAADTSVSTLKHYFKGRDGVLAAVLESLRLDAAPHLAVAATPLLGDVRASLEELLRLLRTAWFDFGVGEVQAGSLAAGLSSTLLGPLYVDFILEPLLQTAEWRITRHVEAGELTPCNARHGALQLLSPLVLGLLHQDTLGGNTCRPLDVDSLCQQLVDDFLAAHPPRTARGPGRTTVRPSRTPALRRRGR